MERLYAFVVSLLMTSLAGSAHAQGAASPRLRGRDRVA